MRLAWLSSTIRAQGLQTHYAEHCRLSSLNYCLQDLQPVHYNQRQSDSDNKINFNGLNWILTDLFNLYTIKSNLCEQINWKLGSYLVLFPGFFCTEQYQRVQTLLSQHGVTWQTGCVSVESSDQDTKVYEEIHDEQKLIFSRKNQEWWRYSIYTNKVRVIFYL